MLQSYGKRHLEAAIVGILGNMLSIPLAEKRPILCRTCLLGPLTVHPDSLTLMIFSVPFFIYTYVYVCMDPQVHIPPIPHPIEEPETCQSTEIHHACTVTAPFAQIPPVFSSPPLLQLAGASACLGSPCIDCLSPSLPESRPRSSFGTLTVWHIAFILY